MRSIQKMFRFVWPYLKKYRGQICVYILVGVVFSSLALVQPFILGRFVDRMTGDLQLGTIAVCCAAFFLTAVLNVALSYYMKITGSRLQIRVSTHMKVQLFQHFQRTSPRFHQQKSSGEMAQKINSDAIFLIMFLQDIAMHFPGKLVCFLLATAYVFFVDIWCGLAVLILLPLLFLLYRYFKERVYKASLAYAETTTKFFGLLCDQFQNVRAIRIHSLSDILAQRFYACSKSAENAAVHEEKVSFPINTINENLDALLKVFLFIYGGISVLNGKMSAGNFTILYTYMSLITASFSYFLGVGQNAQEHMAFYTRMKDLADVPEDGNGTALPEPLTEISAENLHFAYDEQEILTGLTLRFRRDKIYCLAGRNGGGKTTLANLLLGLYVQDTGDSIRYNGIPIRDIDLYRLRGVAAGVSEQEPAMFTGTVGFNLTYRDDGQYNKEALERLAETVGLDYRELNCDSFEDFLALDAGTLSGGQKQKISIIKALYKNPQLLLLDEPTSALDSESRRRLIQHLRATARGRITILISHDEDLIGLADEVIPIGV